MPRKATPNPGALCGRPTRDKTPCENRAGQRTEHVGVGACWLHGGRSQHAQTAGKRELALMAAQEATVVYGLPVIIDPLTALRDELYRTAGHVAWLEIQVRAIDAVDAQGNPKLYGPVAGGKDSFPRQEPHIWVRMYQDERKHLLAVTKTCIDVGIEAARVDAIKEQGAQIATVLRGVLGDLGVLNRKDVPDIVRKHLMVAAGEAKIVNVG